MTAPRFVARSASDRTDEWPFWFVADQRLGGLNVTADLIRKHVEPLHQGATLTTRQGALYLAELANNGAAT